MTSKNTWVRWAGMALACVALAACGGGDDAPTSPPPVAASVGATGGTVIGPNGAKVVIPAGALANDVPVQVEQTTVGAPALPSGLVAHGPMFAFTPHGSTFTVPVTMTVPFDAALLPAGATPLLMKTNGRNEWVAVAGAKFSAGTVSGAVTGFSFVQVLVPLTRGEPQRVYKFFGNGVPAEVAESNQGVLDIRRLVSPGGVFDNRLDGDDTNALEVFSSADGVSFWAGSEGGKGSVVLEQSQSFVKNDDNATLEFVITAATVAAIDLDGTPSRGECPSGPNIDCEPIRALAEFEIEAVDDRDDLLEDDNERPILSAGTLFSVEGHTRQWGMQIRKGLESMTPLLPRSAINMNDDGLGFGRSNQPHIQLIAPYTLRVDLSQVDVGTTFWINATLHVRTVNRRSLNEGQRQSGVGAFLRDPSKTGGTTISYTGITPTGLPRPQRKQRSPIPCATGTDPAAGVLSFAAARFETPEAIGAAESSRVIVVTRTGGSKGAVSAQFTTGGGTAVPGVHYTPRAGRLVFADGDTTPAFIDVQTLPNATAENDSTVGLTPSAPGGCASLGTQSNTVLAILDDDRLPPPPDSGLDLSFGTAGKATIAETGTPPSSFGGDRSGMALQADGKIVMVGGSGADFILARFNADGSLDTGFGIEGKVSTDMGSGSFEPEEALAVAIQADGKIVVVGHATIPTSPPAPRLPPTFALTRYDSGGNPDPSFGTGGRVSGNVNGRAHAVAIQPDGKIAVAGEFAFQSNVTGEGSDITVARFNSNGTLDLGFGGSGTGQLASDIGGRTNTARQLVLQPNGGIVVSGTPIGGDPHTDVMRFNANGLPDSSFGGSGKLTIMGSDVGQGLALQADGKLVLVGTVVNPVSPATSRFLLRRLNADGTPDTGFGTAGSVDTALSDNATAGGVALQADGRIVVVGTRAFSANSNFIVARYAANGALDTGFGVGGTLSIDFFQFRDVGENVLVRPDGKVLVSGSAQTLRGESYGLARINP